MGEDGQREGRERKRICSNLLPSVVAIHTRSFLASASMATSPCSVRCMLLKEARRRGGKQQTKNTHEHQQCEGRERKESVRTTPSFRCSVRARSFPYYPKIVADDERTHPAKATRANKETTGVGRSLSLSIYIWELSHTTGFCLLYVPQEERHVSLLLLQLLLPFWVSKKVTKWLFGADRFFSVCSSS